MNFAAFDRLTETADYYAAARIGMCAFKKGLTRSIVRCLISPAPFYKRGPYSTPVLRDPS